MSLPKLTAVTAGPVAALLAHGPAFRSDFTLTFVQPPKPPLKWTGRMFARDGNFRLEAALVQSKKKNPGAGGFGVIWDDSVQQGFVVSETLQGYAPIASSMHFTNLLTRVEAGQTQRFEGHPTDQASVTVVDSSGDRLVLQVLRARDAGNLPVQVQSPAGESESFTLTLANLKLVTPGADWFVPPDGFTKFENEQTLMDILAERIQSVYGKGQDADETGEKMPGPGQPDHN
jgi:hypothetical protein